jgi:endo-1,4-beta-xylanase
VSLRELADAAGVDVGACASRAVLDDDRAAGLLGREFGRLAVENDPTWAALRPGPDRFAFERADALVALAERHGMAVTGHALVWHGEAPGRRSTRASRASPSGA